MESQVLAWKPFVAGLFLWATSAASGNVLSPASTVVPTAPGTGLLGALWEAHGTIDSNSIAATYLTNHPAPDATFSSTFMDYFNGNWGANDGTRNLSEFLNADAGSLSKPIYFDTVGGDIFRFTGYLNITRVMDADTTTPVIDVPFAIASDDGYWLKIGGTTVMSWDLPRGFNTDNPDQTTVQFAAPGLYPVEFVFWDHNGGIGFEWEATRNGGQGLGGDTYNNWGTALDSNSALSGIYGIIQPQYLYQTVPVPLPAAAWAGSAMLGAMGISRLIRRRRA